MTEQPDRTVTILIPLPDDRTVRPRPRTVECPEARTAPRTIDVPLAPVRPESPVYAEPDDEPTIDWRSVERPAVVPVPTRSYGRHLILAAVLVPAAGAAGGVLAITGLPSMPTGGDVGVWLRAIGMIALLVGLRFGVPAIFRGSR